ncbi:MAG: hypothetical protein WA642_08340 [Steroidobacteraceae bacterium]
MNLQLALRTILASSVAACCVATAQAQISDGEITGNVSSLQGAGWGSGNIGQSVTLDFGSDSSQQTISVNNGVEIVSTPVTFASIVGGPFSTGINLEPNGPGSGSFALDVDTNTRAGSASIITSATSPGPGFTGDVFGMSFFTDGVDTTLEVVRDAFVQGAPDPQGSGEVFISNVNLGSAAQAPEIDPSSAFSALTLLLGGLAVIRGRKFAKAPAA